MTANKVIVGRFGSVHGVRGDIRVNSFTEPTKNILQYLPWQIKPTAKSDWQTVEIAKSSWHNDQLIVQIADVTDRDEAKRYTNLDIAIEREQLPDTDQDEHYWTDLIGLAVVDLDGKALGVVDGFFETGSNDVMVVKRDQEEILIPYTSGTNGVIKHVDLDNKTIKVDWEPL